MRRDDLPASTSNIKTVIWIFSSAADGWSYAHISRSAFSDRATAP